ncbi:MAG: DUF4861 family protein [Bacteroidales bacterium]|nr:DUF4861 family protein [Bacteroidales bacterium]MBN2763584.1 DUF4861 family protein [Bacteroidales bacterium]
MKYLFILLFTLFSGTLVFTQNKTDISLKWKDSDKQETSISSETGNLYSKLSHHGPAIENEWMGLRLYFDYKVAVDVYNKTQTRLELAEAEWYPTPEQQKEGWGADQYKVGKTVGLGGVRLWDGEKVVYLDPVRMRTARVCKEANISYMEMLSEGIPYKGDSIDILVRVTVFSGIRAAKVEAFALCNKPVQFLTGVNYHAGMQTQQGDNTIWTWGIHPEDVAAFQLAIGSGISYNPNDFVSIKKEEKEYQMISKPAKYLSTWIISASEKDPDLYTMEKFVDYLENFEK